MYKLIRSLLFLLPPELAHRVTLLMINLVARSGLNPLFFSQPKPDNVEVMGLCFKNKVGQAAGIDNNGDYIHGLAALGYGHIEVGGITPRAQPGNPKPRIFRLVSHEAIINRKGFPNKGIAYLHKRLQNKPRDVIVGVNIGKNKDTPIEEAFADYQICIETLNDVADYLTVNISSPNTPGLRNLQTPEYLDDLLAKIKACQAKQPNYVPIALKIAPDLTEQEIDALVASCLTHKMDAIIATNTTLDRTQVNDSVYANEAGGLSGKPLRKKSLIVLNRVIKQVDGKIPVISVGGIMSKHDITSRIDAGAALVQLYTGLIYRGPSLIA